MSPVPQVATYQGSAKYKKASAALGGCRFGVAHADNKKNTSDDAATDQRDEVRCSGGAGESLPAVGRPTLLGGGFFAQAAHALLQFFAQRAGGVGIKGYEIPERLRAIATEP
jgi:hypothetical protein